MAEGPLSIKLRCASWQQLSAIYKKDLARGAIFLKTGKPPPMGTAVRIDLTLPTDSMIVLSGYIAEHVPEGGLGGRGPGVDVRLSAIPQSAMWLIETALASAQKGGQTPPVGVSTTAALPTIPADAGLDDGNDLAAAESELLTALTSEFESLKKLNPFQVLGVGYEASDSDVRAAFGELTKRYHPDRFARYRSQELRNFAAEIFILIRDAYRRIGDDKSRQQVVAGLGPRRMPGPPAPPAPARASTSPAAPPPAPRPTAARPSGPIDRASGPIAAPSNERASTAAGSPPPAPRPPEAPLPQHNTERRPMVSAPPSVIDEGGKTDYTAAESLLDSGKYDEALAVFKIYLRKNPADRVARSGIELAEGLRALAQRDRLEAAQRFEAVLEMDPSNERAARELSDMRRQATNERKGLLSRLLGKKE
jgi:TolA-binding protein/Tfp pilus assembly protein PilZ